MFQTLTPPTFRFPIGRAITPVPKCTGWIWKCLYLNFMSLDCERNICCMVTCTFGYRCNSSSDLEREIWRWNRGNMWWRKTLPCNLKVLEKVGLAQKYRLLQISSGQNLFRTVWLLITVSIVISFAVGIQRICVLQNWLASKLTTRCWFSGNLLTTQIL